MRFIDADAFIEDTRGIYCAECARRFGVKGGKWKELYEIGDAPCRACDIADMLDEVDGYHSADVQEVRHGRWIDMDDHVMCSRCGATHDGVDRNYCPNCGAKMGD